ncbi:MAG: reverse transcriptase domain-containing protein, partial [Candidatus Midichloria sp.]|nr:reverse transcriptase domain-containing protein [Candidatus Midichloria sp.]
GSNASGLAPVVSGAPQGSALGPLSFLIFMDDIRCYITVSIKLFADDCVLYKIVTQRDQVLLNDNLLKIKQWCDERQMVLNFRKSVFMSITRKKQFPSYNYS